LEKRAEHILSGSRGVGEEVGGGRWGEKWPNNVSTYEYMNNGKKERTIFIEMYEEK
jgi:hypothetical protein